MEINTTKAKAIEAWIKNNPNEKSTFEKERVELNGKDVALDVWRIPIKLLTYNIRNGRFASELKATEKELNRNLNPENKEDEKIIRELLLTQNINETKLLEESIKGHGQLDPGIITFDGAVINANRRMAIITKIFEETHDTGYEYLRVGILPKGVDSKDLWRIEAGIQFGKDFILEYGPVNELLKIEEGIKQGLKPDDIEATLFGRYTKKDIEDRLEILKQIQSYLEFIGKPEEYTALGRDVEKFSSLHKNVMMPLKRKGISDEDRYKINLIAFSLIKFSSKTEKNENITHWEIRRLKDIAIDENAKKELMKNYNFDNPEKTKSSELLESFNTAKEILENMSNTPRKLLKKALHAISAIDHRSVKLNENDCRDLLDKIEKKLMQLKKRQ